MKKNITLSLLLLLICITTRLHAQAPTLQIARSFGGSENDHAYSIQQTSDLGFIVAGFTGSFDGNVRGNHGDEDFWVVKLNKQLNIQWRKALGGTGDEKAFSVQQTADSGYIVAGQASSHNGQVTGNHGLPDFWVVKLDKNGNLIWQKSLGGSRNDFANNIRQTTDGGYIVAGGSYSDDGDVGKHYGYNIYSDAWIVKLDAAGSIVWKKVYGGSLGDVATSVRQTTDGGYVVAGNSFSEDGDVKNVHDSIYGDFWILKLDTQGNLTWQKTFGGSDYEQANSIIQTAEGGYIAAGWSRTSNDGDVTGNHGNYDVWIVKMNSNGNMLWQKSFGGTQEDFAYGIQQTSDKGYVIGGATSSNNGDVSGNHGKQDFWLLKTDRNGQLLWQKTMGGSEYEGANSVALTKNKGYVMAGVSGFSNVNNGDVTGNHGSYDFWVTKLSPSGTVDGFAQSDNIEEMKGYSDIDVTISPNPASQFIYITIEPVHAAAQIRIMNNAGQLVMERSITKAQSNYRHIDISKLNAGIYFISVQSGKDVTVKTFIKK